MVFVNTIIREVIEEHPNPFEVTLKVHLRTSTESLIVIHRSTYREMGSPKEGDEINIRFKGR